MEVLGTIIGNIITNACDCCADSTSYLCELKQNVRALESSLMELKDRRDDMMERIVREESNPTAPAIRTHEVSGWLKSVDTLERKVERLFQEEEGIMNGRNYFCCWGPKSCYTGSKLGKSVLRLLNTADELLSRGIFQKVTNECKRNPVQEMPIMAEVQGMDPLIDKVSKFLTTEGNHINIVGVHGMGGVGKTTLLMKVNNEFLKRYHDFDLVVWVVISKDQDIKNIQNQIGKYLALSWLEEIDDVRDRATDIFKMLRNKKFLLLLDDIWERIDLGRIGIPRIGSGSATQAAAKSKVVFTTRSESVCGLMEADKKIKVDCLDWEEAWALFQQKVKQEALSCHPDIRELAQKIAKECLGLPLALIAIGRTMASKKTVREWQRALSVLQKYAAEFSGMEEVLVILKFSYDNLQSEKLKSCFLYCSLYPEDYQIDKERLIDQWIGEGFLDEVDDIDEARDEGHDVIGCLIDACLLESGGEMEKTVKMHDVVRDLAIWVACGCGEQKGKYLTVQAQNKLKLNEWKKAERIYLIDSRSKNELIGAPNCPSLCTLLFQESKVAAIVLDDIFQSMPMLKVLDMSHRHMERAPVSIISLAKLQYLNMSHTFYPIVHTLDWLKGLLELKYLILDQSCNLGYLRPGILVCLTKLQMLDLFGSNSSCNWEEENGPSLDELASLPQLDYLGITIDTSCALRKLVTSQKFISCTRRLMIDKLAADITCLTLSPYLSTLESSPMSFFISLTDMASLKSLSLRNCNELEELRIMSWVTMEDEATLIATLERLDIQSNEKLKIVWDVSHPSFYFANLKHVDISECPELKDVTWLIYAVNLEELTLAKLVGLVDVISYEFAALDVIHTFSRLRVLVVRNLKKLEKICNTSVKFDCLESITVEKCPQLKKLPFGANSVKPETLKRIAGETEWWQKHEWEDDVTKSNFDPYCVKVMYM